MEEPEAEKILRNRWIYSFQSNPDGTKRYKTRVVIKGYLQKEGIDYKETFSPVVRFDIVRVLLSIAAREDLSLAQFNVKIAFLHGTLKEDNICTNPRDLMMVRCVSVN